MIAIGYYITIGLLALPAMHYFFGLRVLPNVKSSGEKDIESSVGGNGVSVIIACHNEEKNIARKVNEIIDQLEDARVTNYEIIIVDDGSTDSSVKEAQITDNNNIVKLIKVNPRSGKPNALNLGVEASKFPVLLFSDVRQTISKGAVKTLLRRFEDSDIAAVSSQLELEGENSPARRWMNHLKMRESNKGSTTGVCGALYTLKKEYFEPLPMDTILDDLVIAMNVMKNGKRVVHEPNAIVYDVPFDEFYSGRRQGRITAGLMQILKKHRGLLMKIGLIQLIFLYGQKYLKYTAPLLFGIASVLALFSETTTLWHYSVTIVIFAIVTILNPLFVAQALRLILSYMSQLLRLEKYNKVKWEK